MDGTLTGTTLTAKSCGVIHVKKITHIAFYELISHDETKSWLFIANVLHKDIENKSVNRYNFVMTFLDLLADKKTTVYSLSQDSGVPKTTLTDISSGKADILECTGKTLLSIAKSLDVSIEDLLSLEREESKTLLPEFLLDSINEYRKAVRKDSTLVDCYSDQLNSSINVAEVEHLISKEQADRLRARYF